MKKTPVNFFFLTLKSLHNDMPHLKHSLSSVMYTNPQYYGDISMLLFYTLSSHTISDCVKVPPLKREEALVSRILTAEQPENQNTIKCQISFRFSSSPSGSQLTNIVNQPKYPFYVGKNRTQQKSKWKMCA